MSHASYGTVHALWNLYGNPYKNRAGKEEETVILSPYGCHLYLERILFTRTTDELGLAYQRLLQNYKSESWLWQNALHHPGCPMLTDVNLGMLFPAKHWSWISKKFLCRTWLRSGLPGWTNYKWFGVSEINFGRALWWRLVMIWLKVRIHFLQD